MTPKEGEVISRLWGLECLKPFVNLFLGPLRGAAPV